MNCNKIKSLAVKYELGEADYFERKSFERHVKECGRCRRKYKELLLLSALLYASKKSYSQPVVMQIAKSLPARVAGGVLLLALASAPFYTSLHENREAQNINPRTLENIDTENNSQIEEMEIEFQEETVNAQGLPAKTSIISIYNNREIKYDINIENMQIERREEK